MCIADPQGPSPLHPTVKTTTWAQVHISGSGNTRTNLVRSFIQALEEHVGALGQGILRLHVLITLVVWLLGLVNSPVGSAEAWGGLEPSFLQLRARDRGHSYLGQTTVLAKRLGSGVKLDQTTWSETLCLHFFICKMERICMISLPHRGFWKWIMFIWALCKNVIINKESVRWLLMSFSGTSHGL